MLKNTFGNGCNASSIGGRNSVRMKYQMKSCSSSGTLRNVSTYAPQSVRTRKFFESRPIPMSVPRIVASTMPTIADAQRVGQADQVRACVALGGVELEQALADRESGRLRQEVEPALDATRAHVGERVVDEIPARRDDEQHREDLVDQGTELRAAPRPSELFGRSSHRSGTRDSLGDTPARDPGRRNTGHAGSLTGAPGCRASEWAARTSARPCSRGCSRRAGA